MPTVSPRHDYCTAPAVHIRRRTTSNGYENVYAAAPAVCPYRDLRWAHVRGKRNGDERVSAQVRVGHNVDEADGEAIAEFEEWGSVESVVLDRRRLRLVGRMARYNCRW